VVSRPHVDFWLQAAQCPKGSKSFGFWAALAFIRLMTSWSGLLCRFAVFARQKWWNVPFWSINHCSLYWLCYWVRWWMLQDMDNMEASCVFYVKVGTFAQLEQSKSCLLTVNKTGRVRLTVQHRWIVSVGLLVLSLGLFETNISRHPFPRRLCYVYRTIMRFQLSYAPIHLWKQINNIGPTDCKSWESGKPLQFAVTCSRIHVEYNIQVGCYLLDSEMELTI